MEQIRYCLSVEAYLSILLLSLKKDPKYDMAAGLQPIWQYDYFNTTRIHAGCSNVDFIRLFSY